MVARISEVDIRSIGSIFATESDVAGIGSIGSTLVTKAEVAGLLTVCVICEAAIRSPGAIFGATGLANTDFAAIMSSIPVSKISFFMSRLPKVISCICLLVWCCLHRIKSGNRDRLQQHRGYT